MFWSIFFQSLALIIAIILVGRGISSITGRNRTPEGDK
jgi:hypothetical protein